MKQGRKLDALISEKVMGLEPWLEQDPRWKCKAFKAKYVPLGMTPKPCSLPEYSTDISAAWEVVEKLKMHEPYLEWTWIVTGKHILL